MSSRTPAHPPQTTVVLHGLARTSRAMAPVASALRRAGQHVVNVDYPSRRATIETLAAEWIPQALARCPGGSTIHFVTHSMGGILVRQYLAQHRIERLGRIVMLAPPNQGSEVVDRLAGFPPFGWLNGPAGHQLSTASDSVPNRLPPVDYPVGVIAGRFSWNWLLSTLIPGPNDGKVSVERTKLAGMHDWLLLNVSHPFMMRDAEVHRQTVHFLERGAFDHEG